MSGVAHLVQDLRAEAHTAAPHHAQLMRAAARELQQLNDERVEIDLTGLPGADFAPLPCPIGPTSIDCSTCEEPCD